MGELDQYLRDSFEREFGIYQSGVDFLCSFMDDSQAPISKDEFTTTMAYYEALTRAISFIQDYNKRVDNPLFKDIQATLEDAHKEFKDAMVGVVTSNSNVNHLVDKVNGILRRAKMDKEEPE